MKRWSKKEVELLKSNVNEDYLFLKKILPNRSLEAIIGKKDKMKLKRKSSLFWSDKEDKYLIKNYHKKTINELSKQLNRSFGSIHLRRIRLIQKGIKFKNKRDFFSKYWRNQYKTNQELIKTHQEAINGIWSNISFKNNHKIAVQNMFNNPLFLKKHKENFLKRRNSKSFRIKQTRVARKLMILNHQDIEKHKKILENLRQNPSNQQLYAFNYIKNKLRKKVVLNNWNVLDKLMEIDIAIPSKKIAIEWDGIYWHRLKNQKSRDMRKNELLLKKGWKFIRILDPQLSKKEIEEKCDCAILLTNLIHNPEFQYTGGVYI